MDLEEFLAHKHKVHFGLALPELLVDSSLQDLGAYIHNWWVENFKLDPNCPLERNILVEVPTHFDDVEMSIRFSLLAECLDEYTHYQFKKLKILQAEKDLEDELQKRASANRAIQALKQMEVDTRHQRSRDALKDELKLALEHSYLKTFEDRDKWQREYFRDSDFDASVAEFVTFWVEEKLGFYLDAEQGNAAASVTNHTRIVARAGSGKTTVMAIRAVFLIEHCRVRPSDLLLMAFNRSAMAELSNRIAKYTLLARDLIDKSSQTLFDKATISSLIRQHEIELPWVATFDSVARAISNAGPQAQRDLNLLDESEQKRVIDEISRDFMSDQDKYSELKDVMLKHFKDDWDKLVAFEETVSGSFSSELPKETLLGERVKSFGEKRIADWLFMHGVEYKYEKSLWLQNSKVFPDFTIETHSKKLLIEYLGMHGDGSYDFNSSLKDQGYQKNNVEVLYLKKEDIASGDFEQVLLAKLTETFEDLKFKELSKDELWSKIQYLAESRFRRNVSSFLNRIRRSKNSVAEWRSRSESVLSDDAVALKFTNLALDVCEVYEERLKSSNSQDFIGVMIDAINGLRQGQVNAFTTGGRDRDLTQLKFICMDEYQDFSSLYEELIEQLVKVAGDALIFAVGDNWQSINSYMGAEPGLFDDFERKWPNSVSKNITGNYRSAQSIVITGNVVMESYREPPGKPISNKLGERIILDTEELEITPWERESFEGDEKTAGIVRILQTHLGRYPGDKVTLLARTNSIPWWFPGKSSFLKNLDHYLEMVKGHLPINLRNQIAISTVNSFKGLESDAIVILDALDVSFPLIHKDSRLMSLFGVDLGEILEEERRLFYVAVTRPKSTLYILTRSGHESRFITPFTKIKGNWGQFKSAQVIGSRIICKGGFSIKETLKEANFKFDSTNNAWTLSITEFAKSRTAKEIVDGIRNSNKTWVTRCREASVEIEVVIDGAIFPVEF